MAKVASLCPSYSPVLTQLPFNGQVKAAEDGPNTTHVGAPDEAPGSWLLLGPETAAATIWGMNQETEESHSLAVILIFENKPILKICAYIYI